MASIPQKVIQCFITEIPKFQKVLQAAKDRDVNESDTVSIIIDILSEVFGFDKYVDITTEFMIRGTYCDLAIKIDGKVQFLIEVKAIGVELKENHLRQAINYGANNGIQWVILTNGLEWKLYSIRFEKPIKYDPVSIFQLQDISPKAVKDQELLFVLSKEGLVKKARDEFYEKIQCFNRYTLAHLILSNPCLNLLKKELRCYADGIKIEVGEIEKLLRNDVLKRDSIESEEAKSIEAKVARMYKKKSLKIKNLSSDSKSTQDSITSKIETIPLSQPAMLKPGS